METIELIKNYKSAYTPMEEDAKIIAYYMKNQRETGIYFNTNSRVYIVVNSNNAIDHFSPISTLDKFFSEKKDRKYMKLYSDFLSKWNINKVHFSEFDETFVFDNIKVVFDRFLSLNPEYVTFDLTKDCSVYFQALVNEKNIYFELFFANDIKGGVEAITNIYKNGECIFAYGSTIEDTFSKIYSKIKKNHWFNEPTQAYALPEKAFASSEF